MDFAELIFGMTWAFFVTSDELKFFTSDNPVMLLSDNKPLEIQFKGANDDLGIAFPISPSCALLAHNRDRREEIFEIDSADVDKWNWRVFHTISRYIFCSTDVQARYLLEAYGIAKDKGFPRDP